MLSSERRLAVLRSTGLAAHSTNLNNQYQHRYLLLIDSLYRKRLKIIMIYLKKNLIIDLFLIRMRLEMRWKYVKR